MKKTFSKDYMLQHGGCYVEDSPGKVESLFFRSGNESITIADILNADIPLKDKYWFVINETDIDEDFLKRMSVDITRISLPFRKDNSALQEAVLIATDYINAEITIGDFIEKRGDVFNREFCSNNYIAIRAILHLAPYSAVYNAILTSKESRELLHTYLFDLVNSQPED